MNIFHAIAKGIVIAALGIATMFGYQAPAAQPAFGGTANNSAVSAVFETSLAAPLGSADTTLTLATNAIDSVGDVLPNIYTCFTVDQGQPNNEFLCGTVAGTSVTGLIRGVSPITGTTTVAGLAQTHRRGADIKITDWPTLGVLNNQANGIETFPNLLQYSSNVLIQSLSPSTTIATKYYVDQTAISGAPNASPSVKGISQIATNVQTASSTGTGSTGALLVIPSSVASSSPTQGASDTGLHVVVTGNDDKINSNYIGTSTAYSYTFGAPIKFTATTTEATSTVASTTIGTANIGTLNFGAINAPNGLFDYQDFTSSGTWNKPAGASSTSLVIVEAWGGGGGGGGGGGTSQGGAGGGGGGFVMETFRLSDLSSTVTVTIGGSAGGGGASTNGTVGNNTTFGALLTAYGGGGGGAFFVGNGNGSGGGGGGQLGVGGTGGSNSGGSSVAGGVGGSPNGGLVPTTGLTVDGGFAGGSGGYANAGTGGHAGGNAVWGGGGGGGGNGNSGYTGGATIYGGGGGGAGGAGAAGGTSVTGGTGGAGGASGANGSNGIQPGGGGGGGASGGTGAAGEVRVWTYK